MALDSTANLLFTIGGDSSEGQASLKQFRNVLTGDLTAMKGAFGDWAQSISSKLGGTKMMMLGFSAAAAAGAAALVATLHSAAGKAADYADEIEDGMDKTGLAAEEMSKLRFAAERARVEYDSLITFLVRFERTTVEAARGGNQQAEAFRRLGVSQADVRQGTEKILPLLLRTADAFKGQASTTEKAALAQTLFSRSGADLLEFLSLGSDGIEKFMGRAEDLGLVLDDVAIRSAKTFRIAQQELKAVQEALALEMGKAWLPAETWWTKFSASFVAAFRKQGFGAGWIIQWKDEFRKISAEVDAAVEASMAAGGQNRLLPPPDEGDKGVKKSTQEFEGLSRILGRVQGEIADFGSEEERIAFASGKLAEEVLRAQDELLKLNAAGKITGETFRRESQALASLEAALPALADAQTKELAATRAEAAAKAAEEAARERAELAKADEARKEAFARELTDLQQHLANIITVRMTSQERLGWQYEQDLVAFSAVEEAKSLVTAVEESERQAIRQQYEINRQAALQFYQASLTQLANSTGWRGVFGEEFANSIRSNEALLREWSESANQSLLMVRVALQATEETLQRAFGTFSRAMAQNITQAFIYKQSIGEAMRAAAASALQAIAAESMVQAIYSSAIGSLRLAMHDYPGAAAAFKAAALFGAVGAVAAVAGRAVAPQQAGAGASAGGSGGSGGSGGGSSAYGGSNAQEGPRVTVIVNGHVIGQSGIEELTEMLNEAVQGRDVRLVATAVKQATRATQ